MDYQSSAMQIYQYIGGSQNFISITHCATRLRIVVENRAQCQIEALEMTEGVNGVQLAAGQLQVVMGTGVVNKVYDEFLIIAGISNGDTVREKKIKTKPREKSQVKYESHKPAKGSGFKRGVGTLSNVFAPIIPAIVASGLLVVLLEGMVKIFPDMADSGMYLVMHLLSSAAFVFLPVLIAVSAANVFGGNIFLGAVIGMIMIRPDLIHTWSAAGALEVPTVDVWFGLYPINLVGYLGYAIPVVIAVWFMSKLEMRLHKGIPEALDLFVTPLVTVLVTGYLTLAIFAPLFSLLEAGLLSTTGINTWMPIVAAANVAQGGAALAVAVKSKNKEVKAIALPASLSAFMGITEPAIFGINLKFFKCFIAGCIGGAVGVLWGAVSHIGADTLGVTGIFGFLITRNDWASYLIMMGIAAGCSFVISWFLFREESHNVVFGDVILAPVKGKAIPLSEVPDVLFASESMGKGVGIIPREGKVWAPFTGKVTAVFPTHHAIALTSTNGVEIVIHVGLDTVQLEGEHFELYVQEDESVLAGDLLMEFDRRAIMREGYDLITPVIVANYGKFEVSTGALPARVDKGKPVLFVRALDS